MNILKKFFQKANEVYKITSDDISLFEEIKQLKQRVEQLERENIHNLSRIEELERENISSINAMYEISNSLEARIDMISSPVMDFSDNDGYIVENF